MSRRRGKGFKGAQPVKAPSELGVAVTAAVPSEGKYKHIDVLVDMLSYKRRAGSNSEREWIVKFFAEISNMTVDQFGNIHVDRANVSGNEEHPEYWTSKNFFSAHTDTMHSKDGRQALKYNHTKDIIYVTDDVLGADNGAGCWILWCMIQAGIPGYYVFHRGEERGRVGSLGLATLCKPWLSGFERAVAFDRRGTTSIITHQMSTRCCSTEFTDKLIAEFAANGMTYQADNGGSYTDTASYMGIIPECTNISVGFMSEHTQAETLDVGHILKLRDACLIIDWEHLPIAEFDADDIDSQWESYYGSSYYSKYSRFSHISRDELTYTRKELLKRVLGDPDWAAAILFATQDLWLDDYYDGTFDEEIHKMGSPMRWNPEPEDFSDDTSIDELLKDEVPSASGQTYGVDGYHARTNTATTETGRKLTLLSKPSLTRVQIRT